MQIDCGVRSAIVSTASATRSSRTPAKSWTTLLRRADVTLDERGFRLLTTVAVREAWRHGPGLREQPAGVFTSAPGSSDYGELPEPAASEHRHTDARALDRIEHLGTSPSPADPQARRGEALCLKGLGYSYQEIMRLTGASYTAVNRRITEARAALRDHLGEHSGPRRKTRRRN